ncbi:hypothetical protein BJQ97_02599 [Geobacillus sp. TFV-3]|nr:hypothetical protein BJQ97_02599 [Geobacillus sp. TFV-3]
MEEDDELLSFQTEKNPTSTCERKWGMNRHSPSLSLAFNEQKM